MDIKIIYLTAKDSEEAKKIAHFLLEKKLVACVNILGNIESLYIWNGSLENSTETALLLKTTAKLENTVIESIKKMHSYECPCIMSFSPSGGSADFLTWIKAQCANAVE